MRNIFLIILLVFFISSQLVMASSKREINIFKNIRCLVCQGQSLNDSSSGFAIDLKKLIKKKIIKKQTDQEIYKYLTERYGDWILLNPPLKKNTILLWVIPTLFAILGAIFLIKRVQLAFLNKDN